VYGLFFEYTLETWCQCEHSTLCAKLRSVIKIKNDEWGIMGNLPGVGGGANAERVLVNHLKVRERDGRIILKWIITKI